MRKGGKRESREDVIAANQERNDGNLNKSYAGSRCGLEEWLPHWARVKEERTP